MKKRLCPSFLIILFILLFTGGGLHADEALKKLAVLPFTMNADRDLSFLQAGIVDMLSTRLAWKGRVEVIDQEEVKKELASVPGPLNRDRALAIGKALGADYVILGSLTIFGESVSIDAKIYDVAKSDELVAVFDQSKGMDGMIPTVNKFAENINAKILGKEVYRQGPPLEREARGGGPLITVGEGTASSGQKPSYIQRFKLEIRGLDAGDLDGDGKDEIVIIDRDTVYVYKWHKKRLFQFKDIEVSWASNFIYVNVADLDGNGRAEIYVSNLTTTVSSLVLEWDGKKFKEIASGESWLFRVVDLPGHGISLLGQKRSVDGTYLGNVHLLTRKGNSFVSTGPLNLPRYGNVFNFVQSDLTGKGPVFTTMLGPYEHLLVYNQTGERLWKSDNYFGGSLTFIEDKNIEVDREVDTGVRVFIPSPIFLHDINGDGKQEIMVCQNQSKMGRLFGDFRWFGSGKVLFMDWDGVALTARWTSQKLSGTVVGYQVADLSDDGIKRLAIASVTSESYFIGRPKSRLVMYDLDQKAQAR
ncbi:MAG: VCBS repeat-containing protein [Deltaproteobacteria bacterium]|nr:VCBS repeat-containing protein [Deltaproteobacteria bacterium]MBW2354202.1 VCBS repeat-containing protein [Deltaproteobacteria bacterium]